MTSDRRRGDLVRREILRAGATGTEDMWAASDEALLAGYATGDPDACVVFVRRFQAKLYGLALLITRAPADAEEVAHDAFVRAWQYAASYDPRRGSVAGWLLGIVRNVAIDRVRLASRRRDEPMAELSPEVVVADVDAGELTALRDDVARVLACMRTLPREQFDALVGVTLQGHTARELAESDGLPLGTVKTRIRLGLRKLRDELGVPVE